TPAVQVTAQDAQGNTATAFGGSVTVAIGTNPGGGTLSGTTSSSAVNGVATFTGLNINRAGVGYTLTVSATGLGTAPSPAFNVTAGAATQLVFTVEPGATAAGAAITPPVQVTAQDALGNTDPSFTGQVTVALGANPGNGALSGTTTVAAVAGVTTFPGLSIDRAAAGYTLTAGATGLPVATSAVFTVSAGAANRSEEHTSELQSRVDLVCRLLLENNTERHARRRVAVERHGHDSHQHQASHEEGSQCLRTPTTT